MAKKTASYGFRSLSRLATKTRAEYAKLEKKKYGRSWTREEIVQGFLVDAGELMEETMKQAGIRGEKSREKLIHELCDCLWSILVLADKYKVDLEQEFPQQMKMLAKKINQKLK